MLLLGVHRGLHGQSVTTYNQIVTEGYDDANVHLCTVIFVQMCTFTAHYKIML